MDALADMWPLYGLTIQTPRLTLRLAREDDLTALAAAGVISSPGETPTPPAMDVRPDTGHGTQLLQRHWRALAHWKPDSWHLPLTVYLNRQPIGIQDIWAGDFARLRSAGTGSRCSPQPCSAPPYPAASSGIRRSATPTSTSRAESGS
jgi:hypothetical protein